MSNLYELTGDMLRLESLIEDDEQELDEQALMDSWEGLEGEVNEKVEKWLRVIRNKEADITARKKAIEELNGKNARDQKAIDRMKDTLLQIMNLLNRQKAGTALLSCSVANNGGKIPLVWADGIKEDPTLLPEKWRTKVETWKANTDEIRAALEEGEKIPGVELGERGQHLNIK